MDPEGRVSAHCTERHLSCRAHGAPGRVRGSAAALCFNSTASRQWLPSGLHRRQVVVPRRRPISPGRKFPGPVSHER
jgi:hypothetical protein